MKWPRLSITFLVDQVILKVTTGSAHVGHDLLLNCQIKLASCGDEQTVFEEELIASVCCSTLLSCQVLEYR